MEVMPAGHVLLQEPMTEAACWCPGMLVMLGTYTNLSVIVQLSLRQFDCDLREFDGDLRQS
jgi:hypothetical protein